MTSYPEKRWTSSCLLYRSRKSLYSNQLTTAFWIAANMLPRSNALDLKNTPRGVAPIANDSNRIAFSCLFLATDRRWFQLIWHILTCKIWVLIRTEVFIHCSVSKPLLQWEFLYRVKLWVHPIFRDTCQTIFKFRQYYKRWAGESYPRAKTEVFQTEWTVASLARPCSWQSISSTNHKANISQTRDILAAPSTVYNTTLFCALLKRTKMNIRLQFQTNLAWVGRCVMGFSDENEGRLGYSPCDVARQVAYHMAGARHNPITKCLFIVGCTSVVKPPNLHIYTPTVIYARHGPEFT